MGSTQENSTAEPLSFDQSAGKASGQPAPNGPRGFVLEKEIARGASGVVWRAWDQKLEREVAIKIMRDAALADAHTRARFRAEAAAAAALAHPHIVHLYEAGEEEGTLFLVMELVDGPDLARLAAHGPLPARTAALHLAAAAEGVQCAHDSGVIHRDLKPSNLLLGSDQRVRVADFGLARRESGDHLTLTGDMLGTPGYTSPEQAAGKPTTPLSDIYGLGATLYHLLAGSAPYAGGNHLAVLRQMAGNDPVSLRLLNPSVPRDLETICLKALAHEPARRYATAQELAEDLRRFLAGEPVRAHRAGPLERGWRWCRRRPALAAALLGIVILGASVVVTSWGAARRIEGLRQDAVARLYVSDMRLALQGLAEDRPGMAGALLEQHIPKPGETDQRGFEWYHARELCRGGEEADLPGMTGAVDAIAISGDGRWLAAGAKNLCLWSLPDGKIQLNTSASAQVCSLSFAPDSQHLAVAHADGQVGIVSVSSGKVVASSSCGLPKPVVAWEDDGAFLAFMAGHTRWRWQWQRQQEGPVQQGDFPLAAARPVFSRNAEMLAFSTPRTWAITVFNMRQQRSICEIPGSSDIACSLAFTEDGGILAVGHFSGAISFLEHPFAQVHQQTLAHRGKVDLLAFSRDGQQVASASGEVIRILTRNESQPRRILRGHHATVRSIAFSPDGGKLVSGDASGSVKVWSTSVYADDTRAFAISQDGATLLHYRGGDEFEAVRTGKPPIRFKLPHQYLEDHARSVRAVWRDGLIVGVENPICFLFEGGTVERSLPKECRVDACSPDGRWIYLTRPPLNTPVIWDRQLQREALRLEPDPPNPTAVTFSQDSRHCATGFRSGIVKVYELETARETQRITAHAAWAYQRAFSPDGALLATAGFDGAVRVWDWRYGRKLREFTSASVSDGFWSVAISPDGKRLAAGTGESTVALWDMDTGIETGLLHAGLPPRTIENLCFTPDGGALFVHDLLFRAPVRE